MRIAWLRTLHLRLYVMLCGGGDGGNDAINTLLGGRSKEQRNEQWK
jgi:hypothetical protein